ncbi:nucleotidyltransferase family protein [Pseudochrobactrum sp. MP213Fo]|uniref:nucleotidyltransferase family protein n=1 Tax=Pseudochrobactrum sp. MP213Fo TaxID=3022250 RepID=UPI003BA0D9F4
MAHLRFAGLTFSEQKAAFLDIISSSPLLMDVLNRAKQLQLAEWYIVSGALYNLVWNVLTNRPQAHGIKDIDLFYYDGSDLSYEAEDKIIKAGETLFSGLPLPVEIRNQARVHLWFEKHFGQAYTPLQSSQEGIDRFASKTHAVGIRLDENGKFDLYAPFGLDDIFSFRITPNTIIDNRVTHRAKAARAKKNWPEITIIPWDIPGE